MKRLAHALLALILMAAAAPQAAEPKVNELLQPLHDEWAVAFYTLPEDQQVEKFKSLLPRIHALSERYPDQAEPLVMEAIVLCTYAAADVGLSSLRRVEKARELLVKSIDINPRALEGSAYVTLGNLYYRLPPWPISFGDDDLARQYLKAALRLFPDGLDTNYFYGDFLLEQGEFKEALPYLEKADRLPVRPNAVLSDLKLKEELHKALQDAREQNEDREDFFAQFTRSLKGK